jgi:hypothetical protein
MNNRRDRFIWQVGDIEIHESTSKEREEQRAGLKITEAQESSSARPDRRDAPTEPTSPPPETKRTR